MAKKFGSPEPENGTHGIKVQVLRGPDGKVKHGSGIHFLGLKKAP